MILLREPEVVDALVDEFFYTSRCFHRPVLKMYRWILPQYERIICNIYYNWDPVLLLLTRTTFNPRMVKQSHAHYDVGQTYLYSTKFNVAIKINPC